MDQTVAVNDVARSISGRSRRDHVRVQDLLAKASLPSYNAISVRAVAMEAWKTFKSKDGPNGSRNPLGELIFQPVPTDDSTRGSRAATAGIVPLPLRAKTATFVWNAVRVWNSSNA